MFEENHIDDLMKSILENGQEEVPAHIWNGISEGLDKAERHRPAYGHGGNETFDPRT